MAEEYKVNIELKYNAEKLIILPEKLTVPQFSKIQWTLNEFDEFYIKNRYYRRGLVFTLYFSADSPFQWKKETVRLYGDPLFPPFYQDRQIIIADGIAENKGDFKYGVKVSEVDSSDPIYDEDPYITVY